MMDKEMMKNAKNFDELLDIKYGKVGTEKRDCFEEIPIFGIFVEK